VSDVIRDLIHENVWALVRGLHGAANDTGAVTWQLGHERLVRVGARRGALDAEEAVWMVVCEALGAHRELGYGSFPEYVSAVVGWDVHTAMERIRVARALVRLPALFGKLCEGELSWSAARELSRVALPETEAQWLDACRGARVGDVALSSRAVGRGTSRPPRPTGRPGGTWCGSRSRRARSPSSGRPRTTTGGGPARA
jgi:hypothetical protein